ncbi:DUF4244 domain-containing protein [Arthrobacter sp. GMC3]|uniref:DUF4244 domain-containing protein n=1 Tax=Arthrobacter sp. GMC3 TaxID=2058894 RepID=UPI000CE3CD67|nr:DUF4244 domain-containing protein [Arthrobacter sp. GMC3]
MYSNEFLGDSANARLGVEEMSKVREIYPGATNQVPVANRGRLRDLRRFGSDAGMATAEYAVATLAAVCRIKHT